MKLHKTPSAHRQQGAILIMTAAFIVAAVALLALAVDTGRLYAAQAKLQSAANLAALNTSRYVGGCRTPPDGKNLQEIAQQVVDNNYTDAETPPSATIRPKTDIGVIKSSGGIRTFSTDYDITTVKPNAVRLTLTNSEFKPIFSMFGGNTTLRASAGAEDPLTATISMGTTLAGLHPKLLSQLLGLDTGILQEGDLANVYVSLAQLLGLNAGAAVLQDDLLTTSLSQALRNLDPVLGGVSGGVSQAAIGVTNALSDLLPADPDKASLGDILSILGQTGSDASISAGALINAAAQLAAQRNAAVTAPIKLDLLGLVKATAQVTILSPPKIAVGPPGQRPGPDGGFYTEVKTAQIGITLKVSAPVLGINLPLVIQGARGSAHLSRIDCPSAGQKDGPHYHVEIAGGSDNENPATDVARLGFGTLTDTDGDGDREFQPSPATILGGLLTISGDSHILPSYTAPPAKFDVYNLGNISNLLPQPVGGNLELSDVTGLLGGLDITPNVLGILPLPLGLITTPITKLLTATLNPLLGPALNPILDRLGLSLGTGNISLLSINNTQPQLFCTSGSDCGFK